MLFHHVEILTIPGDGTTVQWMILPQDTDMNEVEVEVQRAGGPNGPWKTLEVVDPNNVFMYRDAVAPQRQTDAGVYYRLVGKDRQTGNVIEAGDAATDSRIVPLYAQEIKRQIGILLRGVNGHPGFVGNLCTIYKQRRFGERCRSCRDAVTGRVTISNCRACAGTGHTGDGYFNPVDAYCKIDPSIKELGFGPLMKTDDRHSRVMLLDVPILYPGDIIVEKSEKHWRVANVDPAEDNERNTVVQFPAVVEIDRGDIVYSKLRHSINGGLRA